MNRSCEFCKYREEFEAFFGVSNWCHAEDKETKLSGYCRFFKEKK